MSNISTRLMIKKLTLSVLVLFVTFLNVRAQAPAISYTPNTAVYTQGTQITPLVPANTGGAVSLSHTRAVFAGSEEYETGTVDGAGYLARFHEPHSIVKDSHGNIFVSDRNNHLIRKITPAGVVSTFAGSISGFADATGNAAMFNYPGSLAIDAADNIYVIENARIRKITAGAVVSTHATGSFSSDCGIVVDSQGNLFISDANYSSNIHKINTSGVLSLFAGGNSPGYADGTGANAFFNYPQGMVIDASDNIYVADNYNNRIRKITPAAVVTTFSGNGEESENIGGDAKTAQIRRPTALAFDAQGSLFVFQSYDYQFRKIAVDGSVSTMTVFSAGDYVHSMIVDNKGNLFYTFPNAHNITKNTVTGFSIKPALPSGVLFNENNGSISGNPLKYAALASYSIIATNNSGSSSASLNLTFNRTKPVITAFTPLSLQAGTPGLITMTGKYFGNSISDINSITYGPAGSEVSATDIVFESSTQIHFRVGALTAGTDYKVIVTVEGLSSAPSDITLRGLKPPAIAYSPNTFSFTEGLAITPFIATNTGDPIVKSVKVSTFAGDVYGNSGSVDGFRNVARFNFPVGMAVDAQGNIYTADHNGHQIRKTTADGTVSTLAGSGNQGSADGQGIAASFNYPLGITTDAAGNVYVADRDNHVIRKITPAGLVSTFAGIPNNTGLNNGAGSTALFSGPWGIAADAQDNIYVTEVNNHTVRKITPAGVVSTLAGGNGSGYADGNGSAVLFNTPMGLDVDIDGNVYVADRDNYVIRKISPSGTVTTLAGLAGESKFADGKGMQARFIAPADVTIDNGGNMYVIDKNDTRVRKVSFSGHVSTIAGSGIFSNENGEGLNASFGDFYGIDADSHGNLFVGDNNAIRKITISGYVSNPELPEGLVLDGNTGTVSGTPLVATPATNFTISASDSFSAGSAPINITVAQVTPVITTVSPALVDGAYAGEITLTGNFFGSGLAGITSITYGANGTGSAATNIKYDSSTKLRFNAGAISAGVNYKVIVTVAGIASAPSVASFRKEITPNIAYQANAYTYTQGEEITPAIPSSTGDLASIKKYTVSTLSNLQLNDGQIEFVLGTASDSHGNLYIVDHNRHSIFKKTPEGVVTRFAGNGNQGFNNGAGNSASFYSPAEIVIDSHDNIFVTDHNNQLIRKIDPAGMVSTFAGMQGNVGLVNGTGTAAQFYGPWGMTIDAQDNIYVADRFNHAIRKITPSAVVTTLAGNGSQGDRNGTGSQAQFNYPLGVAKDRLGNIYVSDTDNHTIRKITASGEVSLFAGRTYYGDSQDGIGSDARFYQPGGMVADKFNNIYVLDRGYQIVRRITPSGIVSTVAGNRTQGHLDGDGLSANFTDFYAMSIDKIGNLIIGDQKMVRKVKIEGFDISPELSKGLVFDENTGKISGKPLQFAAATDYIISASNGFSNSNTSVNITVNQVKPVVSTISPLAVDEAEPAEITLTGTYFGRNLADIVNISYGPNGTGANATKIKYDSDTQIRFTPGLLSQGTVYKVIVSVLSQSSDVSASSFSTLKRPALSFNPASVALSAGEAIIPIKPLNTGDLIPGSAVTTIAGKAFNLSVVNGAAEDVRFEKPSSTVRDAQGNIYVAELYSNVIRKISPDGSTITFAGGGSGDGQGVLAGFSNPTGLSIDAQGNLYVADSGSHLIRKISPTGMVSTLAGSGYSGFQDGSGASAFFRNPMSTAVDASGNVYVADRYNHRIRKITPSGEVTTLAGNGSSNFANGTGTAAMFSNPEGVATDAQGNVFVADHDNSLIRKITPEGLVSTYSGRPQYSDIKNGPASVATLYYPNSIATDHLGNVYFTEYHGASLIRKISPEGDVSTIAGENHQGDVIDGEGSQARFKAPLGLSIDASGNLYVADSDGGTIRKIRVSGYSISPALPLGLSFDDKNGTISGTPSETFPAATYTVTAKSGYHSSSASIAISAVSALPPAISYPATPFTFEVAKPITAIPAGNTGGAISGKNSAIQLSFGFSPRGIVKNIDGSLYVTDYSNYKINKISKEGVISLFAGSSQGSTDGNGANAQFGKPWGITSDASGNLYVSDEQLDNIRKITPAGDVTTLAGGTGQGFADGSGTAAKFRDPAGMAVDNNGNIFVADSYNNLIRKITPSGEVSTFAGTAGLKGNTDGTGIAASFNRPKGLSFDLQGNLLVADTDNGIIRRITPAGVVSTVTNAAGPVNIYNPYSVESDASGTLYIASLENQLYRLSTKGHLSGIKPSGNEMSGIGQVKLDGAGTLYLADYYGDKVFKMFLNNYTADEKLLDGLVLDPSTGSITGFPSVASPATTYSITATNPAGNSTAAVTISSTMPAVPLIAYNPDSHILYTNTSFDPFSAVNTGGTAPSGSGRVSTFAGSRSQGSADGTGVLAEFNRAGGVAVDKNGTIYVADTRGHTIRKISAAGVVSTLAGNGSSGGANGFGAAASFDRPQGIALDDQGNIYVSETSGHRIRKITVDGLVSTLAGNGSSGGINGTGTAASFSTPQSITSDAQGNIYVADRDNYVVRKVSPAGVVSVFAGTMGSNGYADGSAGAKFSDLNGITSDASGNLYVTDSGNKLIRKISPSGIVSTLAGHTNSSDRIDGTGADAAFEYIYGITVDSIGNLYVVDQSHSENGDALIRKITQAGVVTTVVGHPTDAGYTDGIGNIVTFLSPRGIDLDVNGNLYVADYGNSLIRKVEVFGYHIDKALAAGLSFNNSTGSVSGLASAVRPATTYKVTATNVGGSSSASLTITVNSPDMIEPATNVTFAGTTSSGTVISWTKGSGTSRAVFMKADSAGEPVPVADSTYTASTVYGSGKQIGTSGWFSVYNGNGSTVSVSGLSAGTTYRTMVVEYIGIAGSEKYKVTPAAGNPANVSALATDARLNALAISTGTLSPVFASGTLAYTASVANTVSSITLTPGVAQASATISVNGVAVNSGSPSAAQALTVGDNTINIVVTAQDGTTKITYTVKVNREAALSITTLDNIILSTGSLSPVFASATNSYTAAVANAVSSITVNPTATDALAKVTVNGVTVANGTASAAQELAVGDNAISIGVTAQDGVTKLIYTIKVTRAASVTATLSNLTVSEGALSPAFDPATNSYTVNVGSTISSIRLNPALTDATSSVRVNGVTVANGTASAAQALEAGNNTITIAVTAQDGITVNTYTVIVNRAAPITLSSLVLSTGTLSPVFAPATDNYTAIVSSNTSSITLRPTVTTLGSTVTVNGLNVLSGTASAAIATPLGNTVITTVVTSADGLSSTTYRITVSRTASSVASLNDLSVTGGVLSPGFNGTTTVYSTSVPNEQSTITFRPAFTDVNSRVTINGVAVADQGSLDLPLNVGSNTIVLVVTAQDGVTTRTYTFTVFRRVAAEDIVISNLMTPNGDGKNDNWVVNDIVLYPGNMVRVFDRSGRVVFQEKNYTNTWTGTYNSSPLPEGSYYYVIDLGPGNGSVKGFITIVRRK